ncbi:LysR family transcriptional regulator [Chishuiella sp.]|uniref:LysR family transcriptional regulator n=1 Tax=Chishuiella sp. TaxID=1969467 RepID=UPI0028A8B08B|nr:LysR family transcriptional regulator [Chishuiella sp.]
MVNFEWYRTFVAIYQQGNLTKAALELSISQPNVSVHLATLEQYVGGKLFDRIPRKMVPTELGKQLYTQIVESVENLTNIETSFKKKNIKNQLKIRLGSPSEFFYTQLSPKLKNITSQLNVSFGKADDLVKLLIDGELDIVVASQKRIEQKNIIYEPILKENFIIIGNKEIDLNYFNENLIKNNYDKIEEWLIDQKWYAYSNDLAFIRRFWLQNFNKRPMIIPKYTIPNLNTIIHSIAKSGGISVVSDYLFNNYIEKDKIKIIWEGRSETCNTLFLVYDKNKISSEKINEIKQLIF